MYIIFALTDQCPFCNLNETLCYLFFGCSYVQGFRKRFVNWWTEVADDNLMLTLNVIVSFPKRKDILNYLLIFCKLCI